MKIDDEDRGVECKEQLVILLDEKGGEENGWRNRRKLSEGEEEVILWPHSSHFRKKQSYQ